MTGCFTYIEDTGELKKIWGDDAPIYLLDGWSWGVLPTGWVYGDWSYNPATHSWAEDLTVFKARYSDEVNLDAGKFRTRFITDIPGQAETYIYKANEARALQGGADPSACPMLSAEAASTGVSVTDLAVTVLAREAAWLTLGAKIEGARQGALVAIDAATTRADAEAARQVSWEGLLA